MSALNHRATLAVLCFSFVLLGGSVLAAAPALGVSGGSCYGNATCNTGLNCVKGRCVETRRSVGDDGGPCYANATCNARLECVVDTCRPITPGTVQGACFGNQTCHGDLACIEGTCGYAIGSLGASRKAAKSCDYGLRCVNARCVQKPAGTLHGACYGNNTCNKSLSCVGPFQRCLPKVLVTARAALFGTNANLAPAISLYQRVETEAENLASGCANPDEYAAQLRAREHPCELDVEASWQEACKQKQHTYMGTLDLAKVTFSTFRVGDFKGLRATAPDKWVNHQITFKYEKKPSTRVTAANLLFGKKGKRFNRTVSALERMAKMCRAHPLPPEFPLAASCQEAERCAHALSARAPAQTLKIMKGFFSTAGSGDARKCSWFLLEQRRKPNPPSACLSR